MNITGRTCILLEENDDNYKFSCEENNPMFAMLTLLFIYMPSMNVLATLYGPRTAGKLGLVWGFLMLAGSLQLLFFLTSPFSYSPRE